MLRIRPSQMQTFEQTATTAFELRMVDHLRTYFPGHYRIWGPETARTVVKYGCAKAQHYGFVTERNICLYLTLMATLGGNFDKDPQLPWASAILTDTTIPDPTLRIDRLTDHAMEFLDQTVGKNDHYLNRALLRVRNEFAELLTDPTFPDIATHALVMLNKIFPQKYRTVGEPCLRAVIPVGLQRASDYGVTSRRGQLIYLALMFTFGSGFDSDPQLADCALILKNAELDGQEKAEKLHQLTASYVEQWASWWTTKEPNNV